MKKQDKNEKIFELVSKAKEGNEPAFEELYQHYIVPIFRYIFFKVPSQKDAEDLTQIVFLKAWQALPDFQKKTNPFSSWLYKIAKNIVIDYYKKKKEITLDKPIEDLKQIKDEKANPVKIIEQKEKAEILGQLIKQLSDDQQEVIILKFIQGLSNKEMAQLMQKSEEAIRALQYRGLKALREKLKKLNL